MATNMNGRVMARAENGVPIFANNDALFTGYYEMQDRHMRKAQGSMGYNGPNSVNTIFGQFVSAVVFACDNALTAMGVRPWDKSGIRVATQLAKKGGIGTWRGGNIGKMYQPELKQVDEPYKELPFLFGFDIGLQMLESKDDTITWQNYVELQGKTYSDAIDFDMLRPTEAPVPKDDDTQGGTRTPTNEEIQIERLSRIIASNVEVGKTYNTLGGGDVEVTAEKVTPYGGAHSDLFPNRSTGRSAFDSYVDNQVEAFDLVHLDKAWSAVAKFWQNAASPQNKMWLMSFERQREIGGLLSSSQRFLESVFTTRDINGVSTVPGRDAGFVTKAYNDIPIIADGNINVDGTTQLFPADPRAGDVFLIDLDHIWYKALRPVDFRTTDQYQIYGDLNNRATYFMEGELCTDMWACHAKITQKSTPA